MNFLIYGTGGVGGYFGARLVEAGHAVTFVARGENLRAIRENGLQLESPLGNYRVWPVQATDSVADLGPMCAIIICVKAWQVVEGARAIFPLLGPATRVLTLQNGIEAPAQVAEVVGREHVLGGVCRIIAALSGPGVVRHTGMEPTVVMGKLQNTDGFAGEAEIADALRSARIRVELTDDLDAALWQKLLFIAAMSGVGAVTRSAIGEVRENKESREMLKSAMGEIFLLAHANGIRLDADVAEKAMKFVDSLPPSATSSMQRDIRDGRPSELEAIIGVVIKTAKRLQVAVPVHQFIYAALVLQERRARGE